MDNLITQLISFNDLINGNFFKIPDYQRGYSWDKSQLEDLVKDIEHISGKQHLHYTGTIVITKSKGNPDSFRYEIVDGQQRITTLIILLKCLSMSIKDEAIDKGYLKRGNIGNEEYVLETNNETNVYFRDCIINDKQMRPCDIKSHQKLKDAKEFFQKWLKKQPKKLKEIYEIVTNQLGFICFSPENTKEIGIMFEVINNRGKELSELEKIKNYFIYYSTIHEKSTLRQRINSLWGEILKYLSKANVWTNNDEDYFLRNCYIVFYSPSKNKSWRVYSELKKKYAPEDSENIDTNIAEIEQFIDFLVMAAQNYAYFINDSVFKSDYQGGFKNDIANHLKRLRCHPVNASILPLYLAGMSYLFSIPIKPEFVNKFLLLLEILNFRVYVLPNTKIARADSKQGELFSWAHELFRDREWNTEDEQKDSFTYADRRKIEGDIFKYALMNMEDFVKDICPEIVFIQSLTTDEDEAIDYYHWNGLRFFLASYEEELNATKLKETWDIEKINITRDNSKEHGNDYLSKEHIWALKNRAKDFPPSVKDKRRLGNFVLIGLLKNIQLSKDDVTNKIDYLIENEAISLIQVQHLKKHLDNAINFVSDRRVRKNKNYFAEVAIKLIDERETELISFALDRWKMPYERFGKFFKVDSFNAKQNGKTENYLLKK